jgi:drug/metabolite transporter (DMT)-like permease
MPGRPDALLLVVALTAVSTSGPLIAATAAPSLAIAFWRNAMATGALLPLALWRCRAELASLTGREWRLAALAGALLAAHFATWIPSLALTSVASATALVATQPVWAALLARLSGARIPLAAWLGVGLAVLGAGLLTGVDLRVDSRALLGNGLALAGGALAAAYMAAGGAVRRSVSTTTYTLVCYGVCSAILLVVCLLAGAGLGGYEPVTWVQLVALTAGAQLLGHSLFNRVLRTTSATVVSLSILFEVPGAALLALVFLGQVPPLLALPAAVLLVAGVAIVVRASAGVAPASAPAE